MRADERVKPEELTDAMLVKLLKVVQKELGRAQADVVGYGHERLAFVLELRRRGWSDNRIGKAMGLSQQRLSALRKLGRNAGG